MTTELQFLVYSVILGLAHLIADAHFISYQYGYRWTAGRDTRSSVGTGARIAKDKSNSLWGSDVKRDDQETPKF
jgi:hypothetical protein